MRAIFFTLALCAATSLAAPQHHRRGKDEVLTQLEQDLPKLPTGGLSTKRSLLGDVAALPTANTDILDEVIADIEEILGSDESSESKVQQILHTIRDDVEVRNVKGVDVPTVGGSSLPGLLGNLTTLIHELENEVTSILGSLDPSLASSVQKLLQKVNSVTAKVKSEPGLTTRGLVSGLVGDDTSATNGLGLKKVVHDIDSTVVQVERTAHAEMKNKNPSLAKTVKNLMNQVNKVVAKVQNAANL